MHRSTRILPIALFAAALAACAEGPAEPLPRERAFQPGFTVAAGGYTAVTAGENFSCGLQDDGTIDCWGGNQYGQTDAPAGTFKQVEAGIFTNHACAIRTDDSLACWGGDVTDRGITTAPAGTYSDVSVGMLHACAVTTAGALTCWGTSYRGNTSHPAGTDYVEVAAGFEYSCARKSDGTVVCWGWNGAGQTSVPTALGPFTGLSASYAATCAIRSTGELVCWGRGFGGVGGETDPPDGGTWTNLEGGSVGACALGSSGEAACWSARLQPRATPAGSFVAIDQGSEHACAVTAAGTITCWGNAADGRTDAPAPPNAAPTASFIAPASVDEGSAFALELAGVADEDPGSVQYAFDCGLGYAAPGAASTATCPTADDGTLTVRGSVTDAAAASNEYSALVQVNNVAPSVAAIEGDSIMAGETYAAAGSFGDPGTDTFTATVDYGAGAAPLALSGTSFSLSHTYAAAGSYTVSVTVSDDDGGTGSAQATVVVLNGAQAAAVLETVIEGLLEGGALSAADVNALSTTLDAAAQAFSNGNVTAATNQVNAFIKKVEAQVRSKKLASATGDQLIGYANRIIGSMKK